MTRILVIEDDPTVQSLIQKLLTAEGFEVVSASNGSAGVQIAQEQPLDLIISDIMMPGCNGYEVLEQLHQNPDTASIPFIFLSAKSDRRDYRQGMELGADDYLTKPFTRAELLGAIAARVEKQKTITQPYLDEMKRAAENLGRMAYSDPLTSLPNRILLHQRLHELIKQAQRHQRTLALFCLNLDQFKQVNDEHGYSTGDTLLQTVARRLQDAVGSDAVVARLGGDEFSIVLPNVDADQVGTLATQFLSALNTPCQIQDQYFPIQASVGVALYPLHGHRPEQLLQYADIAMRRAKQSRQGKYQVYGPEMSLLITERRSLEAKLQEALKRGEFELHYQPQANLVTGRIVGVEALLRWQDSELGYVSPGKFISIAEETGLIVPIGEWVMRTACQQAQVWQGLSRMPVKISINLSARQFRQPNLVTRVSQILEETRLDPGLLVLEMTETSVMDNVEATVAILQELRAMGVHISIDDFGTGYSSLNYLKRFPLDSLKIDQAFVQDVGVDTNDAAIVRAIIAMANSLQLKVVAEGVETQEQIQFLRQSGCHSIQGYILSTPVTAEEFQAMLVEDKRLLVEPTRA